MEKLESSPTETFSQQIYIMQDAYQLNFEGPQQNGTTAVRAMRFECAIRTKTVLERVKLHLSSACIHNAICVTTQHVPPFLDAQSEQNGAGARQTARK